MKPCLYIFSDDFGNAAIITTERGAPYLGAKPRTLYILKCFAVYDGMRLYFLSTYETLNEAKTKLKEFSAGTFKQI